MARSYKLENERYGSKPEQVKNRTARNKIRRQLISKGIKKKGSKLDVHHKDGNPRNNSPGNIALVSRSKNRNQSPGRPKGKKDRVKRRPRVG